MPVRRWMIALAVCAAATSAAPAADKVALPDGRWLLGLQFQPGSESYQVLLESTTAADGTPALEVSAQPPAPANAPKNYVPPKYAVSGAKLTGGVLTFTVAVGANKSSFEGVVDPKAADRVLGTYGDDARATNAVLVKTDKAELGRNDWFAATELPDAYKEVRALAQAAATAKFAVQREKDADKKEELKAKAADAQKAYEDKQLGLLRAAAEKAADPAFASLVSGELMAALGRTKAKADEIAKAAEAYTTAAAARGPRAKLSAVIAAAEGVSRWEGYADLNEKLAEAAVKGAEKAKAALQVRALTALAAAQKKGNKADALKITTAKLDKLEAVLDTEYKAEVPPFKPEKFAGRKGKDANRVAVMELFTGAQCPPCVAADAAFDALEQAYTPTDLVLIQYHMHIPGPDALTNPDTEARWAYYQKKAPKDVRGVPSSLFNGAPKGGSGGTMAMAKKKYDDYLKVISEALDEKSDVSVKATATRTGDKVEVSATVAGLDKPSAEKKVRLLLVEEEIRYVGGNGIRFHHNVVRSSFGKPEGWAVKDAKDGTVTASVDLAKLKTDLTTYLDGYEKEKSYSFPAKPLAMTHLKLIVLVQDDESGEILQGGQFDVTGRTAQK